MARLVTITRCESCGRQTNRGKICRRCEREINRQLARAIINQPPSLGDMLWTIVCAMNRINAEALRGPLGVA
ncbi:MAG TPA: hypothetical protein GXX28_06140 [Firmicutes bacterium]|nr:hypothetical protein [Bacillota bacterium]